MIQPTLHRRVASLSAVQMLKYLVFSVCALLTCTVQAAVGYEVISLGGGTAVAISNTDSVAYGVNDHNVTIGAQGGNAWVIGTSGTRSATALCSNARLMHAQSAGQL